MEPGYVVLWLFLAAFVAVAASGRGRSAALFFLASLFLSPLIALVILLVIGPNQTKVDSRKLSDGSSRKCPHCAEIIKAEAKVCRFCGRDLAEGKVRTIREVQDTSPLAGRFPDNYRVIPVAEFARRHGMSKEQVINSLSNGSYRGRKVGDRWYIDEEQPT